MDSSEEPIDNYKKNQREFVSKITLASQIIANSSRRGISDIWTRY